MSAIVECYKQGYSLQDLATAFNKTIQEVCKELPTPVLLDKATWVEISSLHPTTPILELAEMYNTRLDVVYKLVKGKIIGHGSGKVTRSSALNAVCKHGNEEYAARSLGVKLDTLKSRAGLKREKKTNKALIEEIRAFNGTNEEAAEFFGVSRSWIHKHVPSGKTKASKPGKVKDWEEVLKYLESNSLTATAKKFGVSPAAINQWKKRNGL